MTKDQAPQDQTASFRASSQRAAAVHEAVTAYAQIAARRDPVFALKTTSGDALVRCTTAAQLT